jgi:hypothetical protein
MKKLIFLLSILTGLHGQSGSAQTLSLAGEWRFDLAGSSSENCPAELSQKIHLPGTMDDAGLGPKNPKTPELANHNGVLAGPYRLYDYAGPAWYQRDIEIPASWRGKRVTLFLERCRWVTTVWLDGQRIGSQDSLIAPHVYDFGAGIAPGKHRLTIGVDNTVKINLGDFVSTLFGGTWGNMNGIVGRIELNATPPVWIDGVQVYPDVDKKLARVAVKIGNATGKTGHGKLSAGKQTVEATWDETGGRAEVNVDMSDAKLWDEFSPNLSEVTVKLGGDERTVRFGMRKFAAHGTQFAMNDRPVFLRGTLECSVWPLTGYPPTDVDSWRRIFQIEKSYGLNFIRFHSWCPPEAAFAAADIEGVMIQAEGPVANVDTGQDLRRDAFIEAEFKRMVDTYGNHPSFCLMTLGNEYGGKSEVLTRWVDMLIQRDSRHLYSSASGWPTLVTANRQWTETTDGRGIGGPATERDLHDVVASDHRPIIGHEIGQWVYYPDFEEIKKWSGVMALKNYEAIRGDLKTKGMLDLAPKFAKATGRQATLLYKEEIEVLLRTPGYGGFSLLDLHDYPTQGTATIGLLDAFWDSKGFIEPAQHKQYCGAVVPLLRMPKRTYTANETFSATADLANYGAQDIADAKPFWKISDKHGKEIAGGELGSLSAPTGKLLPLGTISAALAKAPAPCKLTVTVGLKGTKVSNGWAIWVYPDETAPQPPAGVVVSTAWDKATKAALADGKSVLLLPAKKFNRHSLGGSFLPTFWSPVWFPQQQPDTMGILCEPKHPLFAQFPTDFYSDWQWYDLMQNSRPMILDDTPADFRPLVQVIDNFARNHKLGTVFEARVGKGEVLVCSIDITANLADRPAARQFAQSLYAYLGSAAFNPKAELAADTLDQLFASNITSQLQTLGAKIHADSQAPGEYGADQVIDGDADTMWHTPWDGIAPTFPHELVVELANPVNLSGIKCLPRQDGNQNGWIKDFAVFTSDDATNWAEPAARGTFPQDALWHTVKFATPVKARYLKLVANSSFDPSKPYASLAELDILPVKNDP